MITTSPATIARRYVVGNPFQRRTIDDHLERQRQLEREGQDRG